MRPKSQKDSSMILSQEEKLNVIQLSHWYEKIKPKIIDCKPQKGCLNLNWTFMTWASHHAEQLKKISQPSSSVLLIWTSILLCRHTRKHLVWKNWSLTLHLACSSNATQIVDNIHLPEAHLSLLWLIAPSDQVTEGKKLLCPCSSQHSSVKLLLSTPCAYSVWSTTYSSHSITSCPIQPHPAPSHPIWAYPHSILLCCSTAGKEIEIFAKNKLFSHRVDRTTCSPSQSLQRAWDEEDREFAICSLSMMGKTANSTYLLEWHF